MTSQSMVAGAPRADMTETGSFPAIALTDAMPTSPASSAHAARARDDLSQRQAGTRGDLSVLARTLETEVIPRLVLSRRPAEAPAHRGTRAPARPTRADVEVLAAHAAKGDLASAAAFVATLRERQVPTELIYLELFAPTARHLGELWEADLSDFASVTIGLCCLQQLLLDSGRAGRPRAGGQPADRSVLLAPVPGEQHSFGMAMVGEFFQRRGWAVSSGTGAGTSELVATVKRQSFSLAGFSLASESRLDALASLIREVRRASRNPQIGILVGGRIFVSQPELAVLVGADMTASDGQQAVLKAEALLSLLLQES